MNVPAKSHSINVTVNFFAIFITSEVSVNSLCMCKSIQSFKHFSVIVDRKHVRTHFRTKKVLSDVEEVVGGMVKSSTFVYFRGHDFECSV